MKKLIFLFAMVLTAGMVMAQQTTWVTQSGDRNVANITQDATVSGHSSAIYAVQSGDWNELNTYQHGMDNYIELKQFGERNTADMKQYTKDVRATSGNNTADIYQRGNYGTANLIQKEANTGGWDFDRNLATAIQSGNHNNYNLEQGRISQLSDLPYVPTNTSFLTQSGNRNNAGIDQAGRYDYSEIVQNGDRNTARLQQIGIDPDDGEVSVLYSDVRSYSWQRGTSNLLNIEQKNSPSLESVESVQNGYANTTNVTQTGINLQEVTSIQRGTADIINVVQKNN